MLANESSRQIHMAKCKIKDLFSRVNIMKY